MDTGSSRREGALTEADRALAFIEANLFAPLTVGDIAATCGLSAYHFSRLFTARHDESVMAYVRRRRMEIAADRLAAEPEIKLIDLALDCGFESQEAFTRAFVRAFGDSPGRYRRNQLVQPERIAMTMTLDLQESIERRAAFRVAGISGRFDDETRPGIPKLWDRFVQRVGFDGQAGYETYGVCWGMNAKDGSFTYLAGAELKPGAAAPAGLEVVDVPAQTYLVFKQTLHASELHPQMAAAAKEIWSERVPKSGRKLAGTPDFEFYPADFAPMTEGKWVAWWVPVEV